MERLSDPNPYEVLQVSPNADRQTIKRALAARQKSGKSQKERQRALAARNALSSVDKRLTVDAMTPDFTSGLDEEDIVARFGLGTRSDINWLELVDTDAVLKADVQALLEATVRHSLTGLLPPPPEQPELLTDFDGLEDFLHQWLA